MAFMSSCGILIILVFLCRTLKTFTVHNPNHYLFISWDDIKLEKAVEKGINILKAANIGLDSIMFYVLIGFNSTEEEDLYRVNKLASLGVVAFAMPYNRYDIYQKKFANWCNQIVTQRAVKWEDYGKYDKKTDDRTLEMQLTKGD